MKQQPGKHNSSRHQRPTNGHNGAQAAPPAAKNQLDTFEQEISHEVLAEILDARAYALAEVPSVATTGETVDLLVFHQSGERYGVEVTHVQEIYPLEQLTPVPRTPDFVAGVFSARGRILSVIDLRAFLGLSRIGLSDQTKIIVVSSNHPGDTARIELGILADEVADVVTLLRENLEPPLATHTGSHTEYIQGVTPDLLLVLDLHALLADRRLIVQEDFV